MHAGSVTLPRFFPPLMAITATGETEAATTAALFSLTRTP